MGAAEAALPSAVREVPEWIGATPDTPIPMRVKVRVFERFGGRCYLSGRKIMPGDQWDAEHVIAIINGGENRESNLKPALKGPHREKTKADLATKSKTARVKAKHLGQWPAPRQRLQSRPFPKGRNHHG
jgi:5-methylcytosine-specific restriction protein A